MTHSETKHMIELVEKQTGYRVSIDLISGIHEHARMISARPGNPVHMISVNETHRAFADYIIAVQCGILLVLWSNPQKVPAMALEERTASDLASRWAGLAPLASMPADVSKKVARHYVEGLVKQVQSMPLEISVAKLVFEKCPTLRKLQAESFRAQLQNLSQVFTANVKESAPSEVFEKNVAMNAALALGWSEISGERIALLPYESTGHLASGQKLSALLQDAPVVDSATYTAAVDSWATRLLLDDLYHWDYSDRHA